MPANAMNPSLDDSGDTNLTAKPGKPTASATPPSTADVQRSFAEAAETAKAGLLEAARKAQVTINESLDTLRAQSRTYADTASQRLDETQRYVSERVREKPLTATMAGVGVGLLLGLILAHRGNNR